MSVARRLGLTKVTFFTGTLTFAFFGSMAVSAANISHETLTLHAYSPQSTGMARPVTTSSPLTAGRTYVVTVSGTYAAYNQRLMRGYRGWKLCGQPVYDNRRHGELDGQDAEFIFAKPRPLHKPCPKVPFVHSNFVISTNGPGGPFVHYQPVGGVPSSPSGNHTYTYSITGLGQRASFTILDSNTTDNRGRLKIQIRAS